MNRCKYIVSTLCVASLFLHADSSLPPTLEQRLSELRSEPGYVINFTNVPIVEVVKFVSKIAHLNFVYTEADLNFSVTLTSDGQETLPNVLSAFIQVLRVNGFSLAEDGNNLVIHKNPGVRSAASVFSDETESDSIPPLVTRVFAIKNTSPDTCAHIIRQMVSDGAVVEVVRDSRRLIVSDVVSNVEKIAELIHVIDTERSSLSFGSYKILYADPALLLSLLEQLIAPLAAGNPVIITPQPGSNTFFIVSTPSLLDKCLEILKAIDTPTAKAQKIFVYQVQNQTFADLQQALNGIADNLSETGSKSDLIETIRSVQYIPSNNSIIFTGPQEALSEVGSLVRSLDTRVSAAYMQLEMSDFFIYKLQNATFEQIESSLENLAENLSKAEHPDPLLIATIESVKWIPESNSIVFTGPSDALLKIKQILPTLDVAPYESRKPLAQLPAATQFFVYKPKMHNGEALLDSLDEVAEGLKDSGLADPALLQTLENAKWVESSNSIVFTGDPQSLEKIKVLISSIDVPETVEAGNTQFFVYKPQNHNGQELLDGIRDIAKNLKNAELSNPNFLQTLKNARWVPSTNSLIFTGDPDSIAEIKALIPLVDHPSTANVFVYKIQRSTKAQITEGLNNVAQSLPETDPVAQAIESMQYIPSSNSILFKGSPETITRIQELLAVIDSPSPSKKTYILYKLQSAAGDVVLDDLHDMANNLRESSIENTQLIDALDSAQFVKSTNSIYVTGSPETLEEVRDIISEFDIPRQTTKKGTTFFMYKPQYVDVDMLKDSLVDVSEDLRATGLSDQSLLDAIASMKVVESTQSILFTGTPDSLEKVKGLILSIDNPSAKPKISQLGPTTFLVYKIKYANSSQLINHLKGVASDLESSGGADKEFIKTLQTMRYVGETNSIVFTGPVESLDKALTLVEKFDTPGDSTSNFFMYKPQYADIDTVRTSLIDIAEDLRASGLSDARLIDTITTVKVVDSTQSLLFTGSPDTIEKVKELLSSIDTPASGPKISQIGTTTFLVYKIRYIPAMQLVNQIKSVAADLHATGSADPDFIRTLDGMRYIPETNSIVFTGSRESLDKALSLVEKFDIAGAGPKEPYIPKAPPENFVVYQPKYLSGDELIQILKDFEQNLMASGLDDQSLFDAINSLKWMPKTSSILISGTEDATQRIMDLLERFDVPGEGTGISKSSIETIDDVSFLIYKLQFHQGSDIQSALQKIAADLGRGTGKDKNANLVEAINSLQWIQITNSLIASGNTATVSKLKELIKSIDVPLRQVFIEILIIETEETDTLSFGLRWASQGKYNKKLGFSTASIPIPGNGGVDNFSTFQNNFQNISATNTPTGSNLPIPPGGWDLGVIGDIITHKGNSYFALGSLINALQTDGTSTVVMNQKLIVQDNQQASIFSGENIPYVGSVVTTTQNAGVQQNTNLEYRDVGISLTITPTIGDDDILTLNIIQSLTENVTNASDSSLQTGQINGITTSKNTTQTRVTLPDKHFLALSGTIQNSTLRSKSGIPCLGGIPILGLAFSQTDTTINRTNIIVFLRPYIINTFDEYKQITERQEELYRSQAVAEDYDSGIDLVKTPDDE